MTAGSTTERGYGGPHQREKRRHRPAVDRGDAYCTEPTCLMPDRWIQPGTPWDLAHDHVNGGYLGPAHATCNRTEGAIRGNIGRPPVRGPRRPRPDLTCPICGTTFRGFDERQRTCSRACGAELRRRNAPPRPRPQPRQATCTECGAPFATHHGAKRTCSSACSTKRNARQSAERYHTDPAYREATKARAIAARRRAS